MTTWAEARNRAILAGKITTKFNMNKSIDGIEVQNREAALWNFEKIGLIDVSGTDWSGRRKLSPAESFLLPDQ